jgi:hypothetical protein
MITIALACVTDIETQPWIVRAAICTESDRAEGGDGGGYWWIVREFTVTGIN